MADHQDGDVPESMTIVAWSGDLDKMWPTLILGSTGRRLRHADHDLLHLLGLFPLVRDDVRITGTNAMTKALAGMNRPGISHMKLSSSTWRRRRLDDEQAATDNKVASPKELIEMCLELDVNLWPCEMTMELMGLRPDQLIEGVGEPVGAATALSAMSKSQINLFI